LEQFYLGYQRNALAPGELVVSVKVPLWRDSRWIAAYKVSKRFDQDISAVAVAVSIKVEAGHVVDARIALGGMAATVARARTAEQALLGANWSKASVEAAVEQLAEDFKPLTDMRASSAYRLQVAGNLLRRFYLEHGGSTAPTRTADVVSAAV
jgi:xanthine dehydrogenase small subunit